MEPEVNPALAVQLLVLRVGFLKLHSVLLLGLNVISLPNFTKGSAADFFRQLVVFSYDLSLH